MTNLAIISDEFNNLQKVSSSVFKGFEHQLILTPFWYNYSRSINLPNLNLKGVIHDDDDHGINSKRSDANPKKT